MSDELSGMEPALGTDGGESEAQAQTQEMLSGREPMLSRSNQVDTKPIIADPSLLQLVTRSFEAKPGGVLGYLTPDRVLPVFNGTSYTLLTVAVRPEHLARCWICKRGRWEECSREDYLKQRSNEESNRVEFSMWAEGDAVHLQWQRLGPMIKGQRRGTGGHTLLKKVNNRWIETQETQDG